MKNLSWRVRRVALGLRQRDVADRAGMNQARYSLIERGEAVPTPSERDAIDRVLEVPAEIAVEIAAIGTAATTQ